jgi:superfamily II DNA helicase RecQ
LISDGVVEEFGGRGPAPARSKTKKLTGKSASLKLASARTAGGRAADAEPAKLTAEGEALAARLREWRSAEAKRLRVPAYVVLHDRTLANVAHVRPANPRQLLEINGMGPAKVDRFGEAILGLCGAAK